MPPLTPKALGLEWQRGEYRPAYYLFGEDIGSKSLAIQTLRRFLKSDDFNTSDYSGDSDDQANDIVATCSTPPMFSDRRLVIVRNVRLGAGGRKKIADYLRTPLDTTILVLVSGDRKPASRDALAAGVEALGGVVLFKPLRAGEAVDRLRDAARRSGFELDSDAADFLVEETGGVWGILRAELEKVRLFISGKSSAGLADVRTCLGYSRETNPFELSRSIERRETVKSLTLLRGRLKEGESPFALLHKIKLSVRKQLKAKRMAKSGATTEQIFRELRLQKYYDRDFLERASRIGEGALMKSLRDCLDTEVSLKSKTWLEPAIELEQLVLKVCGKA